MDARAVSRNPDPSGQAEVAIAPRFSAFNRSSKKLLSRGLITVDASRDPIQVLRILMEGLPPGITGGLWFIQFRGIPVARSHSPFDLIYLDADLRVLQATEISLYSKFVPFKGSPESALVLPAGTNAASQTYTGDQLILEEVQAPPAVTTPEPRRARKKSDGRIVPAAGAKSFHVPQENPPSPGSSRISGSLMRSAAHSIEPPSIAASQVAASQATASQAQQAGGDDSVAKRIENALAEPNGAPPRPLEPTPPFDPMAAMSSETIAMEVFLPTLDAARIHAVIEATAPLDFTGAPEAPLAAAPPAVAENPLPVTTSDTAVSAVPVQPPITEPSVDTAATIEAMPQAVVESIPAESLPSISIPAVEPQAIPQATGIPQTEALAPAAPTETPEIEPSIAPPVEPLAATKPAFTEPSEPAQASSSTPELEPADFSVILNEAAVFANQPLAQTAQPVAPPQEIALSIAPSIPAPVTPLGATDRAISELREPAESPIPPEAAPPPLEPILVPPQVIPLTPESKLADLSARRSDATAPASQPPARQAFPAEQMQRITPAPAAPPFNPAPPRILATSPATDSTTAAPKQPSQPRPDVEAKQRPDVQAKKPAAPLGADAVAAVPEQQHSPPPPNVQAKQPATAQAKRPPAVSPTSPAPDQPPAQGKKPQPAADDPHLVIKIDRATQQVMQAHKTDATVKAQTPKMARRWDVRLLYKMFPDLHPSYRAELQQPRVDPVKEAQQKHKQQQKQQQKQQPKKEPEQLSTKVKVLHWLYPELGLDTVRQRQREVRRAPRIPVPGLVGYFFTGGVSLPFEIRNLSVMGFYMLTTERWMPGTIVRVTLQIVGTDGEKPSDTLMVHARVVHWDRTGAGFEFVLPGFEEEGY